MLLNVIQILLLTPVYYPNRIKTNIIHTPSDRMVSAVEHLCVGYYDAISKKKAWAHVNERNVLNHVPSRDKEVAPCIWRQKPRKPIQEAATTYKPAHRVVL